MTYKKEYIMIVCKKSNDMKKDYIMIACVKNHDI